MIRAKKIHYLESPAIAIYFQNMTQYVNQIHLESQILEEKNRNETLESFTSTISHDFRTPLGTSLMFLEQLMSQEFNKGVMTVLNLIVQQLNFLLCLVNNVLDIKMIQQGIYDQKVEKFNPQSTIDFCVAMFKPQSQLTNTKILTQTRSESADFDFDEEPTLDK